MLCGCMGVWACGSNGVWAYGRGIMVDWIKDEYN